MSSWTKDMRGGTTPLKRNKPLFFVWLLFIKAKKELCGYLTANFK